MKKWKRTWVEDEKKVFEWTDPSVDDWQNVLAFGVEKNLRWIEPLRW